jgi:hypothetical protein
MLVRLVEAWGSCGVGVGVGEVSTDVLVPRNRTAVGICDAKRTRLKRHRNDIEEHGNGKLILIDQTHQRQHVLVTLSSLSNIVNVMLCFRQVTHQIEAVVPRLPTTSRFPVFMPGLVESPIQPDLAFHKQRRKLPAVWMRAGTSKGLYLHRKDLPHDPTDWAGVITRVMGSYDSDPKQLNGIGGATSTTSKVAVVSPSTRPGVDVDYTFVQVPIGSPTLDMTGNCGNIASGVGPFAVDEGMVKLMPGQTQVCVESQSGLIYSLLTLRQGTSPRVQHKHQVRHGRDSPG